MSESMVEELDDREGGCPDLGDPEVRMKRGFNLIAGSSSRRALVIV